MKSNGMWQIGGLKSGTPPLGDSAQLWETIGFSVVVSNAEGAWEFIEIPGLENTRSSLKKIQTKNCGL
jgi:hypothetical protein